MSCVFLVLIVNNLYYLAASHRRYTFMVKCRRPCRVEFWVLYTYRYPPTRHSRLFCQENYSKFKNSRIVAMATWPFNVATNKYAFNFNWFGPPRGFLLVQSQEMKTSLDDSGMLGLSMSPSQLHFLSIYEDICT